MAELPKFQRLEGNWCRRTRWWDVIVDLAMRQIPRSTEHISRFSNNFVKRRSIFTALHGMQTRSSDGNSVCPSVHLSVCQTRGLWQNWIKICPDFTPYEWSFCLVFWEKEWLVGATLSTWNFGSTGSHRSEIADFEQIIACRDSAVTLSEKSSINTNRKSTTRFPMSPRWTSYVVPNPPPQRVAQKRKVSKIWTISCDNSETVRDRLSVTTNH